MTIRLFSRIAWETFQWVALFGGVVGLLAGLLLILNSPLLFRFGERMNRWVSTRQAMRPMEMPIEIERGVYRHHRIMGALILAGALYALYVLVLRFKGPEIVTILAKLLRIQLAMWLAESLRVFLVLVNAAATLIALVMVIRPSALKRLEAWANRAYSARAATKPWEIMRAGPDQWVQAYPRVAGAVLLIASAYILIILGLPRIVGHY